MSTGRIVGIVVGSLVLLSGLGLVIGGGGALIAERVLADEDGFIATRSVAIEQDASAVVAPFPVIGPAGGFWWRHAVTLRVEATGRTADGRPVFVGVAEQADVDRYLDGVETAEVREASFPHGDPGRRPLLEYVRIPGTLGAAAPTAQGFWAASTSGTRPQALEWRVESGEWSLVLMNADGSRGISATAAIGFKAPILLTAAKAALGVGAFLLALGVLAIVLCARRPARGAGASMVSEDGTAKPSGAAGTGYPLTFRAEYREDVSPVLWLVKWFLLIPHFIVLGFLWAGFVCSWGLSLLAILFTGRYPRGLFDYNVGVLRWTWRVSFYGYQALATDLYPPFTLRAGGYPADLDVAYPEKLSRRLALVKWWLLAIPHYLILAVLVGAAPHCGGLVWILTLVVGVILLFSSRYPHELFKIVVGANRWAFRVLAYVSLMTDEYPPFQLEE